MDVTVLGLDMFIDLLDRNVDQGEDDLDRLLRTTYPTYIYRSPHEV